MAKVYIEWYGCSLNKADTEKLRYAFKEAGYEIVTAPEEADYCIINTCAVKTPTEEKIISRLKRLSLLSEKFHFKLVIVGCLVEINRNRLTKLFPQALLFGVDPKTISDYFRINLDYSPKASALPYNNCISIIPIARGCLNRCAYCCVWIARGTLKSHPIEEINDAFKRAVKNSHEIWLTATDAGCYGFDLKTDLSELLSKLLENSGRYRIRIGMMNPQHAKRFFDKLLEVMEDKRVYKFFHLPVQSGSDDVLRAMGRGYSTSDFVELVNKAREHFPNATIATDIIVGFPTETQEDFEKTLELIKSIKPDVVNVSRFGARPGSLAENMKQLHGRQIKARSRILSKLCREVAFENNKRLIGKTLEVLVSEHGSKGNFVARTNSYKPVVIEKELFCKFANVEITDAKPTHLIGKVIDK